MGSLPLLPPTEANIRDQTCLFFFKITPGPQGPVYSFRSGQPLQDINLSLQQNLPQDTFRRHFSWRQKLPQDSLDETFSTATKASTGQVERDIFHGDKSLHRTTFIATNLAKDSLGRTVFSATEAST